MTLRRRPCCKHQQVKHTCNSLPLRPVPGSRRGRGRARLQLQALSAGRWGWLGWIPRSGLPSHIHTQNVCGTVNHFFKYRTVAVAAGGGLASAGWRRGTSSRRRWTLRRSRSWWVLDKSRAVHPVTECRGAAPIPARIKTSSPEAARFPEAELGARGVRVSQSAPCREEHALQTTISSSVTGTPHVGSGGASLQMASLPGASRMDLILRVSGPCYIRHR